MLIIQDNGNYIQNNVKEKNRKGFIGMVRN